MSTQDDKTPKRLQKFDRDQIIWELRDLLDDVVTHRISIQREVVDEHTVKTVVRLQHFGMVKRFVMEDLRV